MPPKSSGFRPAGSAGKSSQLPAAAKSKLQDSTDHIGGAFLLQAGGKPMNEYVSSKLPKPFHNRDRSRFIAVYCAGKIGSFDWRHSMEGLDQGRLRGLDAPEPVARDILYVGPFFTTCDHSCTHNCGDHGLAAVNPAWPDAGGQLGCITELTPTHAVVVERSMTGIAKADVVLVYAQSDFDTAHGTHAELGAAHALGRTIIAFVDRHVREEVRRDAWFPLALADWTIYGKPSFEAVRRIWYGVE
jgi:hypothetical protein